MRDNHSSDTDGQTNQRQRPFFSQLSECSTVKQFKERTLATVAQLGFSDFSFTALNSPYSKGITTLPDKVRQHYLKNNLAECDLFLEHADFNGTPIFQSTIEHYLAHSPFFSQRLNRNQQHFKMLAGLDYHDCFCIPHTSRPSARKAVFKLFSRGSRPEDFKRQVVQYEFVLPILAEAIAYFGFNLFPEYFLDTNFTGEPDITRKPLELLVTLAKDGLTLKESAHKLRISVDTANKHVAAAKQSLGATTLANAVYLAMTHGLISEQES